MLPVLENFSVKLSDLYYNWRVPSASLRALGAGALVVLLGPLGPTALYNPTAGVCSLPQTGGRGHECLFPGHGGPLLLWWCGSRWLPCRCTGRYPVFQEGLSLGSQARWPDWVVHFALFSAEKLQEAWSRPVCHSECVRVQPEDL